MADDRPPGRAAIENLLNRFTLTPLKNRITKSLFIVCETALRRKVVVVLVIPFFARAEQQVAAYDE